MQVNRQIKDNPRLDRVDHALGRPFHVGRTSRNHYATDCFREVAEMRSSEWWEEFEHRWGMIYFRVTDAGRAALMAELSKVEVYGRRFIVSRRDCEGVSLVMAKSRSAARYAAYIEADVDWPFMEFCKGLRVRVA